MKLAIIIVILAFCYCGSYAYPNGCSCERGEMDSGYLVAMNSIQPRTRRNEQVQQSLEDPPGTQKETKMTRLIRYAALGVGYGRGNKKTRTTTETPTEPRVGFGGLVPPRSGRGLLKRDMVHLLPEYVGEPDYVDGWTYGDH